MVAVVGIDPGGTGAAVRIETPYTLDVVRFKGRDYSDWDVGLSKLFGKRFFLTVCIEQVHAMPTDGKQSAFIFGRNTGVAIGISISNGFPVEYVDPGTWQLEFGLGSIPDDGTGRTKKSQRKAAHQAKARELLPGIDMQLDVCDAYLIAEYAWRKEHGTLQPPKTHDGVKRGTGIIRSTEFRSRN